METVTNDPRLASVNGPEHTPIALHSEILPNLWQGGTDDEDIFIQFELPSIRNISFDAVYTLYSWANPVDWFVKEVRFGFYDDYNTLSVETSELYDLAIQAHKDWKNGKRVLIRCQAGLNRSGLITALVLIKDGHSPESAIQLMREKRSEYVLMNPLFEKWILETDHSIGLEIVQS